MTNIIQRWKAFPQADGTHDAGGLLVRAVNDLRDEPKIDGIQLSVGIETSDWHERRFEWD